MLVELYVDLCLVCFLFAIGIFVCLLSCLLVCLLACLFLAWWFLFHQFPGSVGFINSLRLFDMVTLLVLSVASLKPF